jgi:hypothetical protein
LCGGVVWEVEGPFDLMSHCHCSRCRKTHGAPFATYVAAPADSYRLHGEENIKSFEASGGQPRRFCGRCGSVVPGDPDGKHIFVPAGNLEADPGARPLAHIFVASKASYYDLPPDNVPRFDAYPPGFDAPTLPDRPPLDPPGRPRGSCLCGAVAYLLEGEPLRRRFCHCSRCRRQCSAAHASNLLLRGDGVRFTRGAEELLSYKVVDAQHFTQVFCRHCGSNVPRIDRDRDLAIVPMGALDDDPGIKPMAHIFVGSKAPWFTIADAIPQFAEYPPSA